MSVGSEAGRPLREADWPRVRELLVDGFAVTAPGFLWDVRRWDGWRYYQPDPAWDPRWEREARAWEDRAGALVAVAHREGPDDLHLQVHPAHRHLEPAMVAWAEGRRGGESPLRRSRLPGGLPAPGLGVAPVAASRPTRSGRRRQDGWGS